MTFAAKYAFPDNLISESIELPPDIGGLLSGRIILGDQHTNSANCGLVHRLGFLRGHVLR